MIFIGRKTKDDAFRLLIRLVKAETVSEIDGEKKRELLTEELRIVLVDLCYKLLAKKTGIDPGVYN